MFQSRDWMRVVSVIALSLVPNLHDGYFDFSARTHDCHRSAQGFAEKGPAERGVHADAAPPGIRLIGTHQLVPALLPLLVLQHQGRPKVDARMILLFARVDDRGIVQPALQEANAPVDFAKALLPVDVLGVLAPVPLRSRGADLGGDPRPFHFQQRDELPMKAFGASAGKVEACRRKGLIVLLSWPGFILR